MTFVRFIAFCFSVTLVGAIFGCASGEIDQDPAENDAGPTDTSVDDVDVEDTFDPCAECADHEICEDDTCIDPCVEEGVECGTLEWNGDEYECGGCPAGECDEGSCPDTCGAFYAECGDIFWEGNVQDCGSCAGGRSCRSNRCIENEGFVDIAAGRTHSCGVTHDGSIRCWGKNNYGQLGSGDSSAHSPSPVTVAQIGSGSELSSLNHHACTTRSGGDVYCWGRNDSGQLGDGTTDDADTPVAAEGLSAFSVATGGSHTCAVIDGERLKCWGKNEFGQLGHGERSSEPEHDKKIVERPGGELDAVVDIALGTAHSCAVRRDNDLWCWGANHSGQLGHGHTQDGPRSAEQTDGLPPLHTVSAGFNHTCAIAVGGDVFCWGRGEEGQLGDGESSNSNSPVEVDLSAPAVHIATGRFHSCAVTDGGDVFCWGENADGQIGQGTTASYFESPVPVDALDDAVAVAAGGAHSCALQRDGTAKCWGDNEFGQIGDGTDDNHRPSATAVAH